MSKKENPKPNKEKKSNNFIIICFTTDIQLYKPMDIIKKYLELEQCSNIKYEKEKLVEYDHSSNAASGRMTKCIFYEISDINKISNQCSLADSYLVFINLESDGIETEIESILKYIENNGKEGMKIYFIGLYIDKNNISCLNEKQEMIEFFDNKEINYEYNELNYNSSNELVKLISHISNDTLKNKMYESLNQTLDKEKGQGKSKCGIF